MQIVVDASPLILLANCNQFDLFPGLASEILIPSEVLSELEAGGARDRAAARVKSAAWACVVDEPSPPPEVSSWGLGPGETAVLAWAARRRELTAVVDDLAARKCARILGVPHIGTLGIVLAAKEAELIPAARPILETMVQAGYYLAGDLLEKALADLGE